MAHLRPLPVRREAKREFVSLGKTSGNPARHAHAGCGFSIQVSRYLLGRASDSLTVRVAACVAAPPTDHPFTGF